MAKRAGGKRRVSFAPAFPLPGNLLANIFKAEDRAGRTEYAILRFAATHASLTTRYQSAQKPIYEIVLLPKSLRALSMAFRSGGWHKFRQWKCHICSSEEMPVIRCGRCYTNGETPPNFSAIKMYRYGARSVQKWCAEDARSCYRAAFRYQRKARRVPCVRAGGASVAAPEAQRQPVCCVLPAEKETPDESWRSISPYREG